jgi:S1-C subfamily serine protease
MTPRLLVMPSAAVLAVLSMSAAVRAQAYLPEDNLAYPVQVLTQGGGGTGFFVRRERNLFLVTARHVLINPTTEQLWASESTLRALSKDIKEPAVTVMHLNLGQLQDERQIRTDAVRDVAVVGLGALTSDGMNTTPGVVVTDRAKGGIIDAPVNHGNSGGPVLQLSRTNRLRIIGIATQFVPVPEDVLPLNPGSASGPAGSSSPTMLALGNSGYGVVASADAIIDLIASF